MTVTVCATFQLALVNVRRTGEPAPAPRSVCASGSTTICTSAVGAESSTTVYVSEVGPASLTAVVPPDWVMLTPACASAEGAHADPRISPVALVHRANLAANFIMPSVAPDLEAQRIQADLPMDREAAAAQGESEGSRLRAASASASFHAAR